MTVRCRKCKDPVDKANAIRQGVSYVCVDCVQTLKTRPDCYNEVVSDDNYRCRLCGSSSIQVHHVKYRSQGGTDDYENLISLCQRCHAKVHASPREDYVPRLEQMIALRVAARDSRPTMTEELF